MNKKKVFFVYARRPGKEPEEIAPKKSLSLGSAQDCDIIVSAPGVPSKHKFLKKTRSGYILRIPKDLDGVMAIGKSSLPLQGIIEFGFLKRKKDCYLFNLPKNNPARLQIGDLTLTFGHKDIIIPEKQTVVLDRALRRPLISREDYTFLLILTLTALINFSAVAYLNTLKIRKAEPIEAFKTIAPKFAKLILAPSKKEVVKKPVVEPAHEEKKEEKKKEEVKEAKKEEAHPKKAEAEVKEVRKEEVRQKKAAGAEEPFALALSSSQSAPSSAVKERIRETVKSKGLLGVITAKVRPSTIPGDSLLQEVDRSVRSIDKVGRGETEEALTALKAKGLERMEEISGNIVGDKQVTISKDISEIIKEQQKITLLEESNKPKAGAIGNTPKKTRNEGEVYRAVTTYAGGLKYLYNNALRKNPALKGKIAIRLTIASNGKVTKAEITNSTINDAELEEAITKRIYRWQFEDLKDADDMIIEYTFDFAQVG